jgi:phage-related protein
MSNAPGDSDVKPLEWVGSSLADLKKLPDAVQRQIGHNPYLVQIDMKPVNAKPLAGFGGASVFEIIEDYDGSTYRAVYTVSFRRAVFVLHVFQKKSKKGIRTPKAEIDLIKARLKVAADLYEQLYESGLT